MSPPLLLSATGLTLGYQDVRVVEDVTFALSRGDVLAVVGHNGSGKSTLIRTLLGGLPPLAGALNWPTGRPQTIAYLGQRTEFDNRFPLRVRDLAAARGAQIHHIDAVVMAQRPKLAPHIEAMRKVLAETMDIAEGQISIKATTTERLGFVGREEGMAAQAVALVEC